MKKWTTILEILTILVCFLLAMFLKFIPEYRASLGSSDHFLSNYKNQKMIEIKIGEQVDFAFTYAKDETISHLFFLNGSSIVLYNQNIEGTSFHEGFKKIILLLKQNQLLTATSKITLLSYQKSFSKAIEDQFITMLQEEELSIDIKREESTLLVLANRLHLEYEETDENLLLRLIDYYSHSVIDDNKTIVSNEVELTKTLSSQYADDLYQKITRWVLENKIEKETRAQMSLPLSSIPLDQPMKIFASEDSWYYVENSKVYAYIKIEKYSYCYFGDINTKKEGICEKIS